MRKFIYSLMCLFVFTGPVLADVLPLDDLGRWTTIKGRCADPESIIIITKTDYKSYEASCKFVKIYEYEMRKDYRMFNRAKLKCLSEGESLIANITFLYQQNPGVLDIVEDGIPKTIYKCKIN